MAAPLEVMFDIPGQPLRRALEQYDTATGISVLYASDLADGRVSTPVHGSYAPDAALRRLIEGTGLTAWEVNDKAFVLRPGAPPAPSAASRPFRPSSYDALVQHKVYQALCAHMDSTIGNYRAALAVRIDAAGRIGQVALLDTTGDPARDAFMLNTLKGVMVGAPPADTSKPFVILILPRPAAAGRPCAPAP